MKVFVNPLYVNDFDATLNCAERFLENTPTNTKEICTEKTREEIIV